MKCRNTNLAAIRGWLVKCPTYILVLFALLLACSPSSVSRREKKLVLDVCRRIVKKHYGGCEQVAVKVHTFTRDREKKMVRFHVHIGWSGEADHLYWVDGYLDILETGSCNWVEKSKSHNLKTRLKRE